MHIKFCTRHKGCPAKIATATLELRWRQYDCPVACVVAQQYFSATFVLLYFHFQKQKCGTYFKNAIISFLYIFKIA